MGCFSLQWFCGLVLACLLFAIPAMSDAADVTLTDAERAGVSAAADRFADDYQKRDILDLRVRDTVHAQLDPDPRLRAQCVKLAKLDDDTYIGTLVRTMDGLPIVSDVKRYKLILFSSDTHWTRVKDGVLTANIRMKTPPHKLEDVMSNLTISYVRSGEQWY